MTICYIYNIYIYDIKNRILAFHLTCIIFRGLSHEKEKCILYMSLDGHDTRQIPALILYTHTRIRIRILMRA